jgi:hypothetical protein
MIELRAQEQGTDAMSYASRWESAPAELKALDERLQAMPPRVRTELEPLVRDALEQAHFRDRVLKVARDALDRLQLDLAATRFDLDATRREKEELRRRLSAAG